MAKSSKVEDYWRENNIENLFKELTQLLIRRMPSDPIIAIVEYLQKKFPKSFKMSSDNSGILSKTLANNLQMQSITTSPNSDNQHDRQISRRLSSQSVTNGIPTIPSVGSAFTDLLKQNTISTQLAPELNIKNLVFANRLIQQAVKMGKNIRSDRDIIDEEIIKPIKSTSSNDNQSIQLISENLQNIETHEEPSVPQLVKYKQQIRTENDRRIHREKLAELAKYQRKRESFFQSDDLEEFQQEKFDDHHLQNISGETTRTTTGTKLSHKPFIKSKEEEEILNDENLFQPQKQRIRERLRKKFAKSPGQCSRDLRSSTKKIDGNLTCKKCGNILIGNDKLPMIDSQQNSIIPTVHSFQPQTSAQSIATTTGTVDDWFESTDRQQSSPRAPDDVVQPSSSTGSSTFRRTLFQPINDTVEHRPPIRPLIPTDDDTPKSKRSSITPRMSETGIFSRSPEAKIHRSSSSRNTPSPSSTKNQQTDLVTIPNSQLIKSSNERRMSGWSVSEHALDDSDEN